MEWIERPLLMLGVRAPATPSQKIPLLSPKPRGSLELGAWHRSLNWGCHRGKAKKRAPAAWSLKIDQKLKALTSLAGISHQ